jgi:multicomponent Na+:H+ antiporter subunit E
MIRRLRPAAVRWLGFICLWLVLFGSDVFAFAVGAATAAVAAWTSLRLLPPAGTRVRPVALARLALRFFAQSVIAGADVAWRALHPALPLRTGFLLCPLRLDPGPARDAFCAIASLLPGTLPAGSDQHGALLVHCLDVSQNVPAQIAGEEAVFCTALGVEAIRD